MDDASLYFKIETFQCLSSVTGKRIVLREEGLRGDDARTTSRAIGRWRKLQGSVDREWEGGFGRQNSRGTRVGGRWCFNATRRLNSTLKFRTVC